MFVFFKLWRRKKDLFFHLLLYLSSRLILTYYPLLPSSSTLPTQLPSPLYIVPSACLQVTLIVLLFSLLLTHLPFQPLPHRLSVSLPRKFFLKPISLFTPSPFHLHRPSSPCLLIFNFISDYFREVTSTCPLFSHLHPSLTILAITLTISVGPLTLSPLPPCMCIILSVPLYFITAHHLNLSSIHLLPCISSFSISLPPLTSSFHLPSLLVYSLP